MRDWLTLAADYGQFGGERAAEKLVDGSRQFHVPSDSNAN